MTENKGGLWGGGGEEGAQEARIGSNIRSIMDRKEQYVISMRTYVRNSKTGTEEDFFFVKEWACTGAQRVVVEKLVQDVS